ncbi:replication-associated recombination protein A [bacterium]|nr:replication-associated recombination protein A [bacterium]
MDLFDKEIPENPELAPLAERMRPKILDQLAGQQHLTGPGRILRTMVERGRFFSLIFWGPPGVGKTTLARILANESDAFFHAISAVTAGVKDIRLIIEQASKQRLRTAKSTILFIDEIHRFNKAQQDALLHSVEDGTITFIGATTENPSFEVIAPLLSRCRVLTLNPLQENDLIQLMERALSEDILLKSIQVGFDKNIQSILVKMAGGDARMVLTTLEICIQLAPVKKNRLKITKAVLQEALQKKIFRYDKAGDQHYDTISAFIKSVRGSDPDAAVHYLARMLNAGEDPLFIARRLIILASEDIGNADPQGLVMANAAFQAVHAIGMPEARIILSQAATYLASAPKSNAAYLAIDQAMADLPEFGQEPVPLHLRNAPTGLMKDMDYGKDYKYAHDYPGGFVDQTYLPDKLKDMIYYRPKNFGAEKIIRERLAYWWGKRKNRK